MDKKITITFTEQEINYALNVLAQKPYIEVAALITNLQNQIQSQQIDQTSQK